MYRTGGQRETRDEWLDQKLTAIRNGAYAPSDFIIADAKDGDMGGGVPAPGPVEPGGTTTSWPTIWRPCAA